MASELPPCMNVAVVKELAQRQRAGDRVAAQALAALRCRGVFPGRERPKPEMPKPWQQELAAAAGRPFNLDAPSHTHVPLLQPWRHAASIAAAPKTPFKTADPAPNAQASAVTAAEACTASGGRAPSRARSGSSPVALWRKWRARQRKADNRAHEAMRPLPPLKSLRAARLPTEPMDSAHSNDAQLRHVDAVVEAVSSFERSSRSDQESDHRFQMLAYAPIMRAAGGAGSRQVVSKGSSDISSPSRQLQADGVQQAQPVSSIEAAHDASAPSQEEAASRPTQAPGVAAKRLGFQRSSGYVSEGSQAAQQQQSIPDLIGIMCGASADSASTGKTSSEAAMVDVQDEGTVPLFSSLHAIRPCVCQ